MRSDLYYTKIESRDGIHVPFPVSRHILRTKPLQGPTLKRNALFAQSASLTLTLALCIASFGMSYGRIDNTISYFRDDEFSRENAFAAGTLAFRLNPGEVTISIKEGGLVNVSPLFTPEDNTFPIKYRVHAEVVGETGPLCLLLNAAGTSSPYIYNGMLKDLATSPATTTGHGHLEISLPSAANIAHGASCTVALVYEGWYAEAPEGTGYTDEERDTFTFILDNPPPQETSAEVIEEVAPTAPPAESENSTPPAETPELPSEMPPAESPVEIPPPDEPPSEDLPPIETPPAQAQKTPEETPPAAPPLPDPPPAPSPEPAPPPAPEPPSPPAEEPPAPPAE